MDDAGRGRRAVPSLRRAVARMGGWLLVLILIAGLPSCDGARRDWAAEVLRPDGTGFVVDAGVLNGLEKFRDEESRLPLERVLWEAGHRAVASVTVIGADGTRSMFEWSAVAPEAWWHEDGRVSINGEVFDLVRVEVRGPSMIPRVRADITDLAPTVAASLGLPAPSGASGRVLDAPSASRAALIFLDGFGYLRYQEAMRSGLVPHLAAQGEPLMGLTVFPPSTRVGTAAMLTGASPEASGVDKRDIRQTDLETLFDVATHAGLAVVAVEGESLAFNLRNATVQLSGDRDGNGSTDDNVLANALAVLGQSMPDLFFVHFHGIDDAGHEAGPGTPEEEAAIRMVDAAAGELLEALPASTLLVIFSDHGMHAVEEDGRLGNHDSLVESDMVIPIFIGLK